MEKRSQKPACPSPTPRRGHTHTSLTAVGMILSGAKIREQMADALRSFVEETASAEMTADVRVRGPDAGALRAGGQFSCTAPVSRSSSQRKARSRARGARLKQNRLVRKALSSTLSARSFAGPAD